MSIIYCFSYCFACCLITSWQTYFQLLIFTEKMGERNLKELFCSQCSLQFNGKYVYNLHLYLVHNVKDDGQKSQSKSENVEDIGGNINGKQSFNCEICKRKFSFRFSLHRHISEVHEEKRPHKKVTMNNHKELVHEEKKKFQCGKCDKAFSDMPIQTKPE